MVLVLCSSGDFWSIRIRTGYQWGFERLQVWQQSLQIRHLILQGHDFQHWSTSQQHVAYKYIYIYICIVQHYAKCLTIISHSHICKFSWSLIWLIRLSTLFCNSGKNNQCLESITCVLFHLFNNFTLNRLSWPTDKLIKIDQPCTRWTTVSFWIFPWSSHISYCSSMIVKTERNRHELN